MRDSPAAVVQLAPQSLDIDINKLDEIVFVPDMLCRCRRDPRLPRGGWVAEQRELARR